MEILIDRFGEGTLMLAIGAVVGLLFGAAAYHSRFCLRAATAEVAQGRFADRMAIWLITFSSALVLVQAAILLDLLDVSEARQLAATGSLSGAIIGGLLFGAGMVLARGCASRLLILSASGNLRALTTGLVLTLTAQAALRGGLSPLRETLFSLWTVPGGPTRHLLDIFGVNRVTIVAVAALVLGAAFLHGWRHHIKLSELAAAALVGLAISLGWLLTYSLASASFEVVAIQSVTFTGPSTDTLMAFINQPFVEPDFGIGLVPGVFVGAFLAALVQGELRIQRFEKDVPMERYILGGILMGFGSMLAGGCAVGAGVTGGAILALTAWVAIFCMWLGALGTQWMLRTP
ncbi:YeeE/YedE family protein [Shimia sp. Alg240-R146]|uniref:YeeE/YedE family protein n=1 Tax=Shimia sp. Alg240-R146 TaxID=2993449 RepID=UPI0022E84BEB|nr:YeeE/YedE family protein [Shimia sp. Alg240-R146]